MNGLHDLLLGAEHKRAPFEHAERVVPGMTRKKLYQLFAERGYTRGAEIGVADGRNALTMCENIPGLRLLCVDPWRKYQGNPRGGPQEQHDRNYEFAWKRLSGYKVVFERSMSTDVLVQPGSLDFVYIDGNHERRYVAADLVHWEPAVRSGGIIAGHDFYRFGSAGVVEAVEQFTKAYGITDWHICDEREPSFWFVKP